VTEETALGREECDGCGRMMRAGEGFETDDGGVWCADCRAAAVTERGDNRLWGDRRAR
jgi:hypothetical protein